MFLATVFQLLSPKLSGRQDFPRAPTLRHRGTRGCFIRGIFYEHLMLLATRVCEEKVSVGMHVEVGRVCVCVCLEGNAPS